ncbi:1-acyl-sn-glycerol-3-phosphate acyltransferase, partial [Actinomyces sp. AC-18-1]|nr:1-acyl-sn-glycerol-3-phosphate acyltransferase [Actinomyces sp. 187325]
PGGRPAPDVEVPEPPAEPVEAAEAEEAAEPGSRDDESPRETGAADA